jgi:hypothetical protein
LPSSVRCVHPTGDEHLLISDQQQQQELEQMLITANALNHHEIWAVCLSREWTTGGEVRSPTFCWRYRHELFEFTTDQLPSCSCSYRGQPVIFSYSPHQNRPFITFADNRSRCFSNSTFRLHVPSALIEVHFWLANV